MTHIEELEQLIEKYIGLFKEMTVTEQQKLQAAKNYDVERLEDCMKSEQAYILQMKGYEQRRLAIQEPMSFQGLSFRQLIPKLPAEDQDHFSLLFNRLQSAYSEFQPVYDCARQMVEVNEHKLNVAIANLNRQAASGSAYSPEGTVEPRKPRPRKDMKI